jgi:hypothetical protein
MRVLVGFWVGQGLTGGFWAVLRELFFGGSDISAQSGGGQFEARDSRICRKRRFAGSWYHQVDFPVSIPIFSEHIDDYNDK